MPPLTDVTSAGSVGQALQELIRASPLAIFLLDLDGTVRYWNPAAEQTFGWTADEVLGKFIPTVPEERLHELRAHLEAVSQGRPVAGRELRRRRKDGTSIDVALWTVPVHGVDGAVRCMTIMADITDRKAAEQERATILAREQAARLTAEEARRAVERAADRLMRLQMITAALSQALTPKEVAEVIFGEGLAAMAASAGLIALCVENRADELRHVHGVGYSDGLVAMYERFSPDAPFPLADAVRTRQPVWLRSAKEWRDRYPLLSEWHSTMPFQASASLPLLTEGRAIGGLEVGYSGARAFDDAERSFLLTIAAQCAQAVERAHLFEQERINKERLQVALEAGQMGTWDWDARTSQVSWSPQLEAIHGLAPGTFGGTFEDYFADVYPADRERVKKSISEALERGIHHLEYRIVWPDGSIHWVEARGQVVYDEKGQVAGMRGVCMEVTQRKRADLAQRLLAQVSKELAGSLDYEATLRTVTRLVVPAFADWCAIDLLADGDQLTRVEVAQRDPAKEELALELRRFAPDPSRSTGVGEVLRTGEPIVVPFVTDEWLVEHTVSPEHLEVNRTIGPSSFLIAPLQARGRVIGTIWFSTVESSRRYSEADLSLATELARRCAIAIDNARLYRDANDAIRLRDEFLSIASHELRNPVAGMKGTAQLLRRAQQLGQLGGERLERYLSIIEQTSARLATLTEDLLDVSRLRRGRMPLRRRQTELVELIGELTARQQAQVSDHQIVAELPSQPCLALVDPDRVEQIASNLLDNAVKYSADGGRIEVQLECEEGGFLLRVRDAGIGLPPDSLERIFEPFGRASNAAKRNIPGLGLGLYICRQIAEQHGGRLWAESPGDGQGTTMSLWLPAAAEVADEVAADG